MAEITPFPSGEPLPDPKRNVSRLALPQDYRDAPTKQIITAVKVGRPDNDFFRVHPHPDYRARFALIVEDREFFCVHPDMHAALAAEYIEHDIFTYVTLRGVIGLWPIKTGENSYNDTARLGAGFAMNEWIRVKSDQGRKVYNITHAEERSLLGEPKFPDMPFPDLVELGFKNNIIQTPDHPVAKRLRGAL